MMNTLIRNTWAFGLLLVLVWGPLGAQSPSCDGSRYFFRVFEQVDTLRNIVYGSGRQYLNNDSVTTNLDIYFPAGDTRTDRPLIIFAHGGTFLTGSKESQEVVPFCIEYAKRGYVTVSINYRKVFNIFGTNREVVSAVIRATQDMKAAVRFFYKSVADEGNPYGIDTNRIILGGASAGAFMALHMAYLNTLEEAHELGDSAWVTALGGLDGGNWGAMGYSSKVIGVINLCGALGRASWIEPGDAWHVGLHGTADGTVPYNRGRAAASVPATSGLTVDGTYVIDTTARATGVDSYAKLWPGVDHVPWNNNPAYIDSILNFVTPILFEKICEEPAPSTRPAVRPAFAAGPNPTADLLRLTGLQSQLVRAEAYDLQGRRLAVLTPEAEMPDVALLRLGELPPGLVMLRLTLADGSLHRLPITRLAH